MARNLSYLLMCLMVYLAGSVQAQSSFDPAVVRAGSPADRASCPDKTSFLWVVVEGRGDCIRYFASGLNGRADNVAVFFHGDWLTQNYEKNKRIPGSYSNYNSPEKMRAQAKRQRRKAGLRLPLILMARPGVLGSSGDHGDRRLAREGKLMDAALTALKARYGVQGFHVAGQSGGGHVVATLLTRRTDIGCAIMSSGVISVRKRIQARGWNRDITGHRTVFDPALHVQQIKTTPALRAIVIGDPRDTNTPFSTQEHYVQAARAAGVAMTLMRAGGGGKANHWLAGAGRFAMGLCAMGVSDTQIQKALTDTYPM